ncbi:MAG: DUF4260 domain-containing protein [Dehalococcoidia bacterium]
MSLFRPRTLLHLEGGVALGLALLFYARDGESWLLFAVLLLAPDLGMLGYLAGPRIGAATYNLLHTYALALPLTAYGVLAGQELVTALGLIWLAHIGMDRLVGYGLKYATAFKDTHLGRV